MGDPVLASEFEFAPLEVLLGPNGPRKVFSSIEELTKWCSEERDFWAFLQDGAHNYRDDVLRKVAFASYELNRRVAEHVQSLESRLSQAKAREETFNPSWFYDNVRAAFDERFVSAKDQIISSDARALFVRRLSDTTEQRVACAALAYLLNFEFELHARWMVEGTMAAYLFERGLTDPAPYERNSLDSLRIEWAAKFEELRKRQIQEEKRLADLNDKHSKQTVDHAEAFRKVIEDEKSDWAKLHETYDKTLRLDKPVAYWRQKGRRHFWSALAFGIAALVVGVAIPWWFHNKIPSVLVPITGANLPLGSAGLNSEFIVRLSEIILGVWLLRVLVRLFFSNIHLMTDAKERTTMAETYLALLRAGGNLDAEDKKLMLGTLFRHTSTGIVKDDAMPVTPAELFTRRL